MEYCVFCPQRRLGSHSGADPAPKTAPDRPAQDPRRATEELDIGAVTSGLRRHRGSHEWPAQSEGLQCWF